ncbi:MAG: hypothetical protein EP315_03115 [Gammaproteobacteria bacterium]|nr:MAG: hypothetical protein EP315_03115 [Gammaproteobacteria bacterium]
MKRGIVKTTLVMLALSGFFLSTWTVHSTTLFQMQHRITHSQKNPDGSYTHILSLELTNHSIVDLTSIKLTPSTDPRQHSVISTSPLSIRQLGAAETASLSWSVKSYSSADHWQQYQQITFTGHARDNEQQAVALTIISEAGI